MSFVSKEHVSLGLLPAKEPFGALMGGLVARSPLALSYYVGNVGNFAEWFAIPQRFAGTVGSLKVVCLGVGVSTATASLVLWFFESKDQCVPRGRAGLVQVCCISVLIPGFGFWFHLAKSAKADAHGPFGYDPLPGLGPQISRWVRSSEQPGAWGAGGLAHSMIYVPFGTLGCVLEGTRFEFRVLTPNELGLSSQRLPSNSFHSTRVGSRTQDSHVGKYMNEVTSLRLPCKRCVSHIWII